MRLVRWRLWGAILSLAVLPALAEEPNPQEILIEKIQYNGDGCRPGSVASNVSPDAKAFTLLFDDFIVDTSTLEKPNQGHGKGHGEREQGDDHRGNKDKEKEKDNDDQGGIDRQKACNLVVDMAVPPGWKFAVFSIDYRGFAQLGPKAIGHHRTVYSFAGGDKEIGKMQIKGPRADDYRHSTSTPLGELEFSGCQGKTRKLRLRTDIRVQGRGLMTVDSLDGELKQRFGIAWRRCPLRLAHP